MPSKIQAKPETDSIKAEDFYAYVDGVLLANSKDLGWQDLQAQALRYESPSYESQQLPWIENSYAIEIQTSGNAVELEQKIKQWTKQRWYRGEMVFFPYGEKTHWRWNNFLETVVFFLPVERWQQMAAEMFECDRSVELLPKFSPEDNVLRQILLLLAQELHNGGVNGTLFVDGLATAAIAHLLKHHSTVSLASRSISHGLSSWQLKRIVEYIDANLERKLSLKELAKVAEVGTTYFPQIFRQTTNSTPYQFVLSRRLEHSKKLLAERVLSIAEIALEVGFANQSHFTTAFRKVYGDTPASYRKAIW